jgi:hypothetical protein
MLGSGEIALHHQVGMYGEDTGESFPPLSIQRRTQHRQFALILNFHFLRIDTPWSGQRQLPHTKS